MAITAPFKVEQNGRKQYHLGQHVLAEFFECDTKILNDLKMVEKLMVESALECGATIVQKCFHMFNPYGVSGVIIIAESHLAIHTWPELGYAAVDLFTCGSKCDPTVAFEYLRKSFKSKNSSYTALKRGIIDEETSSVAQVPFELAEHYDKVEEKTSVA